MKSILRLGATALFVGAWLAGCGSDNGDDDAAAGSGAKGGSAGRAGGSQGGSAGTKGGSGGTSNAGKSNGGKGGSIAGDSGSGGEPTSSGGSAGRAGRGGTGGTTGGAAGESGQSGAGGESAGASEGGAAGAGGSQVKIPGCASTGDSAWSHVVALIPCQTSLDEATGVSALTAYNTPTISASPAGAPGGASCSLGNGGSINTAKGFQVVMPAALGTGDFTVEISVYQTQMHDPSDQQSEIIIADNSYPPAAMNFPTLFSHAGIELVQYIGGTGVAAYTDTTSALNVWESYAVSRVDGVTYVFKNGTALTSFADATDYTGTTFHVSHQANGTYNALMGSVAQIRVTRGVGRYTTNYETCADGFASE